MKIQDIGFFLIFAVILLTKHSRWLLMLGLICWILAIPLFAKWVFFTAERLTWYGAGCVFVYTLSLLFARDTVK